MKVRTPKELNRSDPRCLLRRPLCLRVGRSLSPPGPLGARAWGDADLKKTLTAAAALGAALAAGTSASAANLVTNGSFEINGGNGQLGFNTSATGWTVADPTTFGSYAFIFNASPSSASGTTADTT